MTHPPKQTHFLAFWIVIASVIIGAGVVV